MQDDSEIISNIITKPKTRPVDDHIVWDYGPEQFFAFYREAASRITGWDRIEWGELKDDATGPCYEYRNGAAGCVRITHYSPEVEHYRDMAVFHVHKYIHDNFPALENLLLDLETCIARRNFPELFTFEIFEHLKEREPTQE